MSWKTFPALVTYTVITERQWKVSWVCPKQQEKWKRLQQTDGQNQVEMKNIFTDNALRMWF